VLSVPRPRSAPTVRRGNEKGPGLGPTSDKVWFPKHPKVPNKALHPRLPSLPSLPAAPAPGWPALAFPIIERTRAQVGSVLLGDFPLVVFPYFHLYLHIYIYIYIYSTVLATDYLS